MRTLRLLILVLLVCALAPASASAVGVDLLSQANLRIDAALERDGVGTSVAAAGDVNGDGRDDVIVGAPLTDNNGRQLSGSAYVVYGSDGERRLDLQGGIGESRGFQVDGAVFNDVAGSSVAGVGDVNGDGFDDVAVSAPDADPFGDSSAGSVYVIFGARTQTGPTLVNGPPAGRGFRIDGIAADDRLSAVDGAGDFNGDGRDDLILGAAYTDLVGRTNSGSVYMVFGAAAPSNVDLSTVTGDRGFRLANGGAAGDFAGSSVAGAGDVNGDNRGDVIIGASGVNASGASYVIYGRSATFGFDLGLPLAAGEGFRIDGASTFDAAGTSVAGAGDVNADGRADVIVGAPSADPAGTTTGAAYVVYGAASQGTVALASGLTAARGFRIDGAVSNDRLGFSVDAAGDIDSDGYGDVIAGATTAGPNGRFDAGASYVVYGAATQGVVTLAGGLPALRGFRIDGPADSRSGSSVAGAGDFDGDGRDEVIVGAPNVTNNGRPFSGSAYLVGANFLPRLAYDPVVAQVGQPLDQAPALLDASSSATLAVTPALPAGLTLNAATGRVTGTPAAPSTSTHTVTVTDPERGRTRTQLRIVVGSATGPAGPSGQQGQAGPQGPTGAQGQTGSQGPAGSTGQTGPAGPSGTQGAAGPVGPSGPEGDPGAKGAPGRDAKVTCTVRPAKNAGGAPRVTCAVQLTKPRAAVARVTRGGRTVARGRVTRGGRLQLRRALAPGRYTLHVGSARRILIVRGAHQ